MTTRCLPLEKLDPTGLVGVFTDIDDTLTTGGRLPADVYAALEHLRDTGLAIVPVTGRSAGWAHLILHLWPVEAVIAESGGVCLYRDPTGMPRWQYHDEPARIAEDRREVCVAAERLIERLPGFAWANDNAFRLVDVAIDHSETVKPVPRERIAEAIVLLRADGVEARASSVHINSWRGQFDKAPMALRYLAQIRGATLPDEAGRWLFVGDAPNDASMFASLSCSVGVANLAPFIDQLPVAPAFLTTRSQGAGFIELAAHLLRYRIP